MLLAFGGSGQGKRAQTQRCQDSGGQRDQGSVGARRDDRARAQQDGKDRQTAYPAPAAHERRHRRGEEQAEERREEIHVADGRDKAVDALLVQPRIKPERVDFEEIQDAQQGAQRAGNQQSARRPRVRVLRAGHDHVHGRERQNEHQPAQAAFIAGERGKRVVRQDGGRGREHRERAHAPVRR